MAGARVASLRIVTLATATAKSDGTDGRLVLVVA
jgi:hypothetical protein